MNAQIDPRKFQDPAITAKGEPRASVFFKDLKTLWFNSGSLCNIECVNCYIESSPTNDRLAYMSAAEVAEYLVTRQGNVGQVDQQQLQKLLERSQQESRNPRT